MSILPTRREATWLARVTAWATFIASALSFVGLPMWVTVWLALTAASAAAWGKWGPIAIEVKPTPYGPDSAPGHRGAAKRDFPPNDGPSTTEAEREP